MYEQYWHLDRKPFEPSNDPADYYPSETHQGALLKLRYAVESHRGAALLAGPAGTGKTLVLQTLARQLPENAGPFAHLVFPQMSPAELLAYLADELGAPKAEQPGVDHAVRRIERFLSNNSEAGRHAVVAVDEAQMLADTGALETMRLLLNFETDAKPGMTLILAGQTSLVPLCARMPTLDERLGVKTLLRPFALEETISYVNHRLTAAGATQTIFESAALEMVHDLAHGVPRKINRLCDLALLIGFAEQLPAISTAHVESVCEELVTVAPE